MLWRSQEVSSRAWLPCPGLPPAGTHVPDGLSLHWGVFGASPSPCPTARPEPPYPVLLLPLPFGSASQEQSDAAAPTQAPAKVGTRISGKTPIAGAGATLGPSSGDKTGARNPLRHDPGGTAPAHEQVPCYGGESRLLRDVPRRHGPARAITSVGPVQPGVRALHTPRPFLTWNSHSTCSSRLRLLCNRGGSHALPRPERYYR